MYQEPSAHHINSASGVMSDAGGRYIKRLRDLDGLYLDTNAFQSLFATSADEIVYTVHEQRPTQKVGDLIFGT
ncbi:MAG: glucose-6-phosphate isomerase, partial [Alphaproteobacteria bacterium]|nr:glucose-6-phosphate isomerase [Alphaproteobacteria bacterium]